MRILHSLFFALSVWTPFASAQTLTITHVTLIDITNGRTQPDTTVTIDGNRIAGIAHSTAPGAGQIVDASGQFLIPGLWDMRARLRKNEAPSAFLHTLF